MTEAAEEHIDHKEAMHMKALILADLIESGADNEIIGLTVKMLAIDYLQFCKEVGLDSVNPMSREKIETMKAGAKGMVN